MAAAPAVARAFAGPARLKGVDLARGIAVIGMLAAHLASLPTWEWSDPRTWTDVANGRSSVLFAVLAGVSVALVTGGAAGPRPGPDLIRMRLALVVRGIALWALGLLLMATGVPVYVILPTYGALFILSVFFLRLSRRALWASALVLALVMPWLQPPLDALPLWQGAIGQDLALMIGWYYPFTVWIAFLVAGMAAGRSDLSDPRTQGALLLAGSALAIVGYGLDALIGATFAGELPAYLEAVLTAGPHSSGLLEVIGAGGLALAVIAACQLVCRARVVAAMMVPLRAVGSMPLTAYVGQIVVWAIVAQAVLGDTGDLGGMRELGLFWAFTLGTVAFCTAWALWRGRGPLEDALALAVRWVLPRPVDRLTS